MGTREQDEGRGVPGQQAVAVGGAQVYQAGRDLHVHPAKAQPALRRGDLTPRVLPGSVHPAMRAPLRGRTEALAFLRKNVAQRKHVVVTGPPGAGKSLLLRHAANKKILAGIALGDDVGTIWVDTPPSVVDVLGAVLRECFEFDRSRAVPDGLAREALRDVRALVVLDDVDLTPDEIGQVLSVLRGCVVVLATRRDDLWSRARQLPLGALPLTDAVTMVRDELDDRFDAEVVAGDWDACDGNPAEVVGRAVLRDTARTLGELPDNPPMPESMDVLVPAVVGSLSAPARNALRALVALSDVWWGAGVLAAACGTPDSQGAAKLVRTGLVREDAGRYSVGDSVARYAGPAADLVPLVDRVAKWTATARPGDVAGELRVVEQALRLALAAELHDTALALARNASATLTRSRHLGAAMTVLGLGLRAAIGAGSVREELSFRYAMTVCRLETGNTKQALEMAIATASLSRDDTDKDLALRVRELHAEVQHAAAHRPLSTVDMILARATEVGSTALATLTAGAKAVRQACVTAVTNLPGGVQLMRLVQENPGIVRSIASIAVVTGLVLTTVSASSNYDQVNAAPADPTTAWTQPAAPDADTDTTGGPEAPDPTGGATTTSPPLIPGNTPTPDGTAPDGTTPGGTTPGGTTPGGTTPGGQRPDRGGTDPEPPGEPHQSVPATWGFARVWYVDRPIGTTHALSGPGAQNNDEANWTYGPWAMSSPPAGHPTATHTAVGRHRVRLPAVGAPGGSVQVTAQDYFGWNVTGQQPGASCRPATWFKDGADEVVDVLCADRAGNPHDVAFLLRYVAGSATAGRGHVLADQPTTPTYVPDWRHSANAGAVTRTDVGRYTVEFPGSAGGVVQATAVGVELRHCAVTGRRGDIADVACTAHDGVPADSVFTAVFGVAQNLFDDPRKPVGDYVVTADSPTAGGPVVVTSWASGGTPISVTRTSTGRYRAHFANGLISSTMHATSTVPGNRCTVVQFNDYSFKDDTTILVGCTDATGTPVNSGFDLVYSSARIY